MAILITGGTGFVGGTIVRQLVENASAWKLTKDEIFVLVRENSNIDELKQLGVKLVKGDLTDEDSLQRAVKGIEIVFHLGAVVLDQTHPDMLQKVNVIGTQKLLDAFVAETTAKKFVFVSTWGVYGYKVGRKPMTEDRIFDPTTDYHKSKVVSENLVWDYSKKYDLPVAVARLPMILGPGDTLTTPRVVQALFDNKVKMIGKGKNLFSAIHVEDAARAIITMGFDKEGKVYNVKSFDISQKDYWFAHIDAIDHKGKIPVFPKWLAMFYAWTKEVGAKLKGLGKPTLTRHRVMRYGNTRVLDTSRIEQDLNWKPQITDGIAVIKETVKWLNDSDFIDWENKKVVLKRRWEDAFIKNKAKVKE